MDSPQSSGRRQRRARSSGGQDSRRRFCWVLSRLLSNQPLNGELALLTGPQRELAEALAAVDARAGTLRLYDRKAVAMVRHELNAIDARRCRRRGGPYDG